MAAKLKTGPYAKNCLNKNSIDFVLKQLNQDVTKHKKDRLYEPFMDYYIYFPDPENPKKFSVIYYYELKRIWERDDSKGWIPREDSKFLFIVKGKK